METPKNNPACSKSVESLQNVEVGHYREGEEEDVCRAPLLISIFLWRITIKLRAGCNLVFDPELCRCTHVHAMGRRRVRFRSVAFSCRVPCLGRGKVCQRRDGDREMIIIGSPAAQ